MIDRSEVCSVGAIVDALFEEFPKEWAEPWDRVGLVVGDPVVEVSCVAVTLDADARGIEWALSEGAQMLVTHHPPSREAPSGLLRADIGPVWEAITNGLAIASFHTDLDRSPIGAAALPEVLGLPIGEPLERGACRSSLVVTYAPAEAVEAIRKAMEQVGAGRVGEYSSCSFESQGRGYFVARAAVQSAGAGPDSGVDEIRIETTCPLPLAARVAEEIAQVHPYEEPMVIIHEIDVRRGSARFGRVCDLGERRITARDLAGRVAKTLHADVRLWGDADTEIARVATVGGSATAMLSDTIASGADALVCGEVRYHGAKDALDAGLVIIEAGHDASEWPLVGVLGSAVEEVCGPGRVTIRSPADRPELWRIIEVENG